MLQLLLFFAIHLKMINTYDVPGVFAQSPSLLTPATLTFSVWGFVNSALLAFCVYHLILAYRHVPSHAANNDIRNLGYWFVINNVAASAWLIAWTHKLIVLSMLLILCQLFSLVMINLRTGLHDTSRSIGSKIFTQFPLSIYSGWITMITITNTAYYLSASIHESFRLGLTATEWTKIMISATVIITLLVIVTRRNISYGLVILWVLYGIIVRLNAIGPNRYADIIQTTWIGMALISFTAVIQLFRNVLSYGPESTRFLETSPVNNTQY